MNRHVTRSRVGEQPKPAGSFATSLLLVPLSVPKDPADRKLTGTHLVRVLGVDSGKVVPKRSQVADRKEELIAKLLFKIEAGLVEVSGDTVSLEVLRSLNDFSRSILVLSVMLTIAEVLSFLMLTTTRSPLRETIVPVTLAFLPESNFRVGVAA